MDKMDLEYTGDVQPPNRTSILVNPNKKTTQQTEIKIYPYYPDEGLKEAVQLAIQLRLPLLLEGEPGCGKSRLAHDLVYELNHQKNGEHKEIADFYYWNVKSTSKGQDALYTYDYIGRLQAAELRNTNQVKDKDKDPKVAENFVEYQPLGQAFKESQDREKLSVVLIDEIDKADRDFPNDLLLAIEERAFYIKETQTIVKASEDAIPIIIITSNQEKKLPDAFLRRCLYHYIELPTESEKLKNQLERIIKGRFSESPEQVVQKAIERFCLLRGAMDADKMDGEKKVSTSELISWFEALIKYPPEKALEMLEQEKIPLAQALLKSKEDIEEYGGG
jgi:MoxR-like ATPase